MSQDSTKMLNDVALMLYSLDLNEKHGTTFQRGSWPGPGDMDGHEYMHPDVPIRWANTIKTMYTDKARPLVKMLLDAQYVHIDNELY